MTTFTGGLERLAEGSEAGGQGGAVIYRSRGAVLVLGDADGVLDPACTLATSHQVVAFAPGIESDRRLPRRLTAIGGRVVSLTGHLGRFRAHAAIPGGGQRDIAPFSPNADGLFDVVLDLSATPLIPHAVAPHGYFAPRDPAGVAAALAAISELRGAFRQPRYVDFDASSCVHGRKGLTGCARCVEVCDAAAIHSTGAAVTVDPYLCQGCAACTLACPTGALSFAGASRDHLLKELGSILEEAASQGVLHPLLVIRTPGTTLDERKLPPFARMLEVPALPAFGEELWLALLASGARGVLIVDEAGMPERRRDLLRRGIAQAESTLQACGQRVAAVVLVNAEEASRVAAACHEEPEEGSASTQPWKLPVGMGKRELLIDAVAALSRAGASVTSLLPDATFGAVKVDHHACTVCLACVNVCPTGALIGHAEAQPRLEFRESACVQCGLCVARCPEEAMNLLPRIDAAAWVAPPIVLAEDDMVPCAACKTPFIGRKVLARSIGLLQGQAALTGTPARTMTLCMECRARSMF